MAGVVKRRSEMSALLDDISRIIASPIPRRQALRLLGGVVGGGVLAYLGRGSRGLGAPAGGEQGPPRPFRCGPHQFLCGGTCCDNDRTCCNGNCCPSGQTCCNRNCCPAGHCCGDHCCDKGETCCGDHCCDKGETCCRNRCCAPGRVCCNNRCVRRRPSTSNPCREDTA